jgi:hypothetical protein
MANHEIFNLCQNILNFCSNAASNSLKLKMRAAEEPLAQPHRSFLWRSFCCLDLLLFQDLFLQQPTYNSCTFLHIQFGLHSCPYYDHSLHLNDLNRGTVWDIFLQLKPILYVFHYRSQCVITERAACHKNQKYFIWKLYRTGLTLSLLMLHICGVSKMFGEWYQKTNKTEDTNKLTLLAFQIIIILHNTRLATFIKLLETVSKGLFRNQ